MYLERCLCLGEEQRTGAKKYVYRGVLKGQANVARCRSLIRNSGATLPASTPSRWLSSGVDSRAPDTEGRGRRGTPTIRISSPK